eukprot:TRINITY_DN37537_c0_g1_i1.p1 TRINITY_DN37537_c0_g1~~TRINITY_DN37537_c0_g1_i1.p1  ORF type:complete len:518 (-),score=52.31 TRINITY_DN37537_c0_g1_i1:101-1591(-)
MVIEYEGGYLQMNAICRMQGSVFPKSCLVAVPSTLLAVGLAFFFEYSDYKLPVLENSAAYSSFTFVVGFLLVFRTQTAYSRFWEGATFMQQLRGQWVGAFGSLIAFSASSKREEEVVLRFRLKLIRVFSSLHACALDHIYGEEDGTTKIIGIDGLDDESLDLMNLADDEALIYVIVQWVQQMILHNINEGVITTAPPIVSRVFQDLSQGIVTVNNAKKISETPFPFPYCQTLQMVLVVHAVFTPLVFVGWCRDIFISGMLTFVAVALFWSLNFISAEIEHPFGTDPNDICREKLQDKFNKTLVTMLSPGASKRPQLRDSAGSNLLEVPTWLSEAKSYSEAWSQNNPDVRLADKGTGHVDSLYQIGTAPRECVPLDVDPGPKRSALNSMQSFIREVAELSRTASNFSLNPVTPEVDHEIEAPLPPESYASQQTQPGSVSSHQQRSRPPETDEGQISDISTQPAPLAVDAERAPPPRNSKSEVSRAPGSAGESEAYAI